MNNRNRMLTVVLIALILGMTAGYALALNPTFQTIIQPGSQVTTSSFIIFTDGITNFARNGKTGAIDYSGAFSTILQSTLNTFGTFSGGEIKIKRGNYQVASTILVPSYTTISGETWTDYGGQGTQLNLSAGVNGPMFLNKDYPSQNVFITLQYLAINATKLLQTTGQAIHFRVLYSHLFNLRIVYSHDQCIWLDPSVDTVLRDVFVSQCGGTGIELSGGDSNTFDRVDAENNLGSGISAGTSNEMTITNSVILQNQVYGIYFNNVKRSTLINNEIAQSKFQNIYLDHSKSVSITGGTINHAGGTGIELDGTTYSSINGVLFLDDLLPNTQTYAVSLDSPADYNVVVNNNMQRNPQNGSSNAIGVSGTHNIIQNNLGYNPRASSTVTASASVWTYTNNDGYIEAMQLITVAGITQFACNGNAIGNVLGTVCILSYNQQMQITWATTAPVFMKIPT